MEPCFPFHTVVELVDAEEFMREKFRFLDLPLEVDNKIGIVTLIF